MWTPFKTTQEFIQKDQKLNNGLIQGLLFGALGYGVGLLLFKGKTLRGVSAGAFGAWRFKDQID